MRPVLRGQSLGRVSTLASSGGSSRRFGIGMFTALTALSAVHPLASDSPLVSFPETAKSLDASAADISLTFTAFLLGLALGTLVFGAISDASGRKKLLVGGPIFLALLSAGCALSGSVWVLILFRFGQGAACASSVVAARAAVTDWVGPTHAARPFALMSAGAHLAPLLAPLLGSWLLGIGDWRTIYWGLTVISLLYASAAFLLVPETLSPKRRHAAGARTTILRLKRAGTQRHMPLVLAASALAMGAHNSYVATSSFIVQTLFGKSASFFTAMLTVNSGAMVVSAMMLTVILRKTSADMALRWSLIVNCLSAFSLAILSAFGSESIIVIWACMFTCSICTGIVIPSSIAVAQRFGAPYQGSAAALQGFLNYLLGAAVSPVASLAGNQAVFAMSLLMSVLLGVSSLCVLRMSR